MSISRTINRPVTTVVDFGGTGLEPPEFAVDPNSISANLLTGQTESQTLTLTNGGGTTSLDLQVEFIADVTVHESPDLGKDEVDVRPGILDAGGPDLYGYRGSIAMSPVVPPSTGSDISARGRGIQATRTTRMSGRSRWASHSRSTGPTSRIPRDVRTVWCRSPIPPPISATTRFPPRERRRICWRCSRTT